MTAIESTAPAVRTPFVLLLRVLAVLTMAAMLWQPTVAGLFTTGRVSYLTLHDIGAGVAALLVALDVVAAVLLRWPGRGSAALIPHAVAMLVLVGAQMALGFTHLLAVHLPLGVLLFGMALGFTARAFARRKP